MYRYMELIDNMGLILPPNKMRQLRDLNRSPYVTRSPGFTRWILKACQDFASDHLSG
jgi:hypothetical protein